MSMRYALFGLLSFVAFSSHAFQQGQLQDDAMYVYQSGEDFAFTKENLEMAITNRGLNVSGTLHVEEMLTRTGADLGFTPPFAKAEAIEFCSAVISHQMVQLDPLNMSICPFTLAVFAKKDDADGVYVAFRKIKLAGQDAQALTEGIEQFLHGIVKESLGLD